MVVARGIATVKGLSFIISFGQSNSYSRLVVMRYEGPYLILKSWVKKGQMYSYKPGCVLPDCPEDDRLGNSVADFVDGQGRDLAEVLLQQRVLHHREHPDYQRLGLTQH